MTLVPINLRVNDLPQPVGTPGRPYFGWHLEGAEANQVQTAYHLLVAASAKNLAAGHGDVWDSGVVASSRQSHVPYEGPLLACNTRYAWCVRVWDGAGRAGPYSSPGTLTTGLLTNDDWAGARWIRRDSHDPDDYTYYRKTVPLPQAAVTRATVFVTAVHKYVLYLNGRWIGGGPSYHYPHHQYYNAYDITDLVLPGAPNVFAVLTHWFGGGQGRPASARGLLLKAIIEHPGRGPTVIGTDASWQQTRAAGWQLGQPSRGDEGVGYVESIDAARLLPGWQAPGFDDAGWERAADIGAPPVDPWTGGLYPDLTRIVEHEIGPASVTDHGSGTYVLDLGRVFAGRPRITFTGGAPGARIAMRGGYTLGPDGTIDPATTQSTDMSYAATTDGGAFVFEPLEYLGLRYFQVDSSPMPVTAQNFKFVVRHAVLDDGRSTFDSSDSTLNEEWALMKRSVCLGAQEQFLDTPTREKGGFLVDSAHESLAAMAAFGERVLTLKTLNEFLHSMDQYWSAPADHGRMNAVYPNGDGARDIPDFTQAYLVWVWEYYLHTGNAQFLSDKYAKLKRIAGYVARHLDSHTGLVHRLTGGDGGPYQHGIVDWPPSMRYGYDMETDARTVVNALAYADFVIVARIAALLGQAEDAARYEALAGALKEAMNARLLNAAGVYVDGLRTGGAPSPHASQHANMLPLALGMVPAENRTAVLEHVKRLRVSVGMVTIPWLIRALGEAGEGEHLLKVYTRPDWDGWANSLAKGATSTWESWDADRGADLSQSHPWGTIGLCGLQEYVLGVKPLAPQCERVQIKPLLFGGKLARAGGTVPTERGEISIHWEQAEDRFALTVSLPVNVRTRVCVPGGADAGPQLTVDGASVTGAADGRYVIVENVGSGMHRFERRW